MILTIKISPTASPTERVDRMWFQYLWHYYQKNRFNLIKAAEDAGVKLYFFKNQLRLNPFLVKQVMASAKRIYLVRNQKTKFELLVEDMIVKSKDPRDSMAYKFGTKKTRKEIDIIIENNKK